MKHLKKITAMLLALLMVVGLTACGAQEEVFAVCVDLPEELATLDPAMVTNDAERTVVSHLYENLMKLTHLGEGQVGLANGLAANYECVNNLDGTQTYTFSLRPGITWSDGEPVKAEDFVYAWQRLADPKTESPNAEVLEMVAGYAEARKKGDMSLL
jgi:oligopeptide transport system substrate-binding protein